MTPAQIESVNTDESQICMPCKCIGSIKYIHKDCLKVRIQIYHLIEMDTITKSNLVWALPCDIYKWLGQMGQWEPFQD